MLRISSELNYEETEWSEVHYSFKTGKTRLCFQILVAFWTLFATALILLITTWYMTTNVVIFPDAKAVTVTRNPAIVWYTKDMHWLPYINKVTCRNSTLQCDVFLKSSQYQNPEAYLFYATYIEDYPLPKNHNTIWGLIHEESPKNILEFVYEESLSLFNFSSTFSRFSDVPFPLHLLRSLETLTSKEFYVNTSTKNAFLTHLAPVLYMQNDCDTTTERDEYVKVLMEYIKVDSYGECLHNKDLVINRSYQTFLSDKDMYQFIAKYKFMIAIENGVCNDYMTEKLWRPIQAGVVPIYFGAPQIRDWLPNNKSAILLEDFPTPELLSQHLHYLLNNDTAYEEYLEHKTLGKISNQNLLEEIRLRPYQTNYYEALREFETFICERIYDKNNTKVNVVTRAHYDCPLPVSALTLSVNPTNVWIDRIEKAKTTIDMIQRLNSKVVDRS
ncbi:alpha-(1,3)-fucosyltransferase 10-like [Pectinophora gossypiella]|uniref:alpha-(1,3)-fucosyltransferase 10-like n=1 Tax=Pectinophora gossypiella TaxID=13191 RepID=UPI00214EBE7D|nr:alpha-(1,3)-fucosyltransferase 10-like [Pectinophora gossypiella]